MKSGTLANDLAGRGLLIFRIGSPAAAHPSSEKWSQLPDLNRRPTLYESIFSTSRRKLNHTQHPRKYDVTRHLRGFLRSVSKTHEIAVQVLHSVARFLWPFVRLDSKHVQPRQNAP